MSIKLALSLPEKRLLDIRISMLALRSAITRGAGKKRPQYRIMFRLIIRNSSAHSLRILGRKWILRDQCGITRISSAEKIFNQRPLLVPAGIYNYAGCQDFNEGPPAHIELRFFGEDHGKQAFISQAVIFPLPPPNSMP